MKKITCSILLLVFLIAFAACGDDTGANGEDEYAAANPIYEETQYNQPGDDESLTYYTYDAEEPGDPGDPDEPDNLSDLLFHGLALVYRGTLIEMDQRMDHLLQQLGEPLGIFEAPSCAFDGIDRIFGFPGIEIRTYPDGDLDRVHTINIMDDSVTTMRGIRLGNSWADVVAAYGSGYEQDITMFTFTIDRTTLSFFLEGDMVIGIIYGLIMD